MKICIAYINYKEDTLVKYRLESISKLAIPLNILIIDNSGELKIDKEYKFITISLLSEGNTGFSGGANIALKYFQSKKYRIGLILNPDVEVDFKALLKISVQFAASPYAGWMFPARNELNQIQYTSIQLEKFETRLKIELDKIGKNIIIPTDYLAGCAMLLDMKYIGDLRFDTNFFLYYEEVDFSKQLIKRERKIGSYQGLTVYRKNNSREKKINSVPHMWKSSTVFRKKYNLDYMAFFKFRLFLILFLIKAYLS